MAEEFSLKTYYKYFLVLYYTSLDNFLYVIYLFVLVTKSSNSETSLDIIILFTDPNIKPKNAFAKIAINTTNIISKVFLGAKSPYPIVLKVVITK